MAQTGPQRRVLVAVLVVAVLVLSTVVVRDRLGRDDTACAEVAAATDGRWCRVYQQDFGTPAPLGSFVNASADDWYLRPGHPYADALRTNPDGWRTIADYSLNYASRTAGGAAGGDGRPGGLPAARAQCPRRRACPATGRLVLPGARPRRARRPAAGGPDLRPVHGAFRHHRRIPALGGGRIPDRQPGGRVRHRLPAVARERPLGRGRGGLPGDGLGRPDLRHGAPDRTAGGELRHLHAADDEQTGAGTPRRSSGPPACWCSPSTGPRCVG